MPPIQVKDFFKTLAEKAQMGEAQEYLKGIRKKMGVESFVQAHEEGLFNNKKFALSNAEKMDAFTDGATAKTFNSMKTISLYKTGLKDLKELKAEQNRAIKAQAEAQKTEDQIEVYDPDVVPLTPEQQAGVDYVAGLQAQIDAMEQDRAVQASFMQQELAKANQPPPQAMVVADPFAVDNLRAQMAPVVDNRLSVKDADRNLAEERQYSREDLNKAKRLEEVNKRRSAVAKWIENPDEKTEDLLQQLGFDKRQLEDGTDERLQKVRRQRN